MAFSTNFCDNKIIKKPKPNTKTKLDVDNMNIFFFIRTKNNKKLLNTIQQFNYAFF